MVAGFEFKIKLLESQFLVKEINDCCHRIEMICRNEGYEIPSPNGCFSWTVIEYKLPSIFDRPNIDREMLYTSPPPDSNKKSSVQLFKEHHIKAGETLKSIAFKYRVTAKGLSEINNIRLDGVLLPGKIILIPINDE